MKNSPLQCEIAFFSQKDLAHYAPFLKKLGAAFIEQPIEFQSRMISDLREIPQHFSTEAIPHIVVLDPAFLAQDSASAMDTRNAVAGLRELDPALCTLVLSDSTPSSQEIMHWLDIGATGLLSRTFESHEIHEALQEALYRRLSLTLPRHPRAPICHKIQLQISSLEQALVAETLNIGFGGLFVRTAPREIKVHDRVEFELLFSNLVGGSEELLTQNPLLAKMDELPTHHNPAQLKSLKGIGSVVWVRSKGDPKLPEGVGIQFLDVAAPVLEVIKNFVATHRIRAFIPKA